MNPSEWNAVEPLIADWFRRARENQHGHYEAAKYYGRFHYFLGVPVVFLSCIVGTSIFATLQKEVDLRARIAVALVSVLAAILAGLQTFLRFGENAAKHRAAGAEYGAIRREIEQLRALPPESRGDAKPVLDKLRNRFDSLAKDSLEIPAAVWTRAQKSLSESRKVNQSKETEA